jgi:hypothetical protein
MKKAILFLCFLTNYFYMQGQVTFQELVYIKGWDDVRQTADTGYAILGKGINYTTTILYKLNGNGDSVWAKEYDVLNPGAVRQTSDGGYVIVGGSDDVFLIKTNAIGDTVWTKAYGNNAQDAGTDVQQTIDGGYIIAGYTEDVSSDTNAYVIKTNSAGDTLWTRIIGGIAGDAANSLQQTADGGYIITGYTRSFGAGGNDLLLIKLDTNGIIQWTKTYGGPGDDAGESVRQVIDGGYIVTGYTKSFGTGYKDTYLIRTNATGNVLWAKTFGYSFSDDIGYSVDTTSNDGFIVTGIVGASLSLINLNSSGDTLWTRGFGPIGLSTGKTVLQTTDGGFIAAGVLDNGGATPPNPRAYIVKTDSSGNGGCNENSIAPVAGSALSLASAQTMQMTFGGMVSSMSPVSGNALSFHNTLCSSVTGINEKASKVQINVFPNPSSGIFLLNIPGQQNVEISITVIDIMGRQILDKKVLKENELQIDLSNFPEGVYILKIVEGKESSFNKVILKMGN